MFKNIGEKIKNIAMIWVVLGILTFVVGLISSIDSENFFIFAIVGGSGIAVFLCSYFIYGFGELVENSATIKNSIANSNNTKEVVTKSFEDDLPEI